MNAVNAESKRTREMRNLIRRGTTWYFKKMVHGKVCVVSLKTDDLELAKASRNKMEQAAVDGQWDKVKKQGRPQPLVGYLVTKDGRYEGYFVITGAA